jgi:hypothetical protein
MLEAVAKETIMNKSSELDIRDITVRVVNINGEDYICLTDMLKAKDGEFFITDWLHNRNTLEFIGIWEQVYNPSFNYGEFATIRNQAEHPDLKVTSATTPRSTSSSASPTWRTSTP